MIESHSLTPNFPLRKQRRITQQVLPLSADFVLIVEMPSNLKRPRELRSAAPQLEDFPFDCPICLELCVHPVIALCGVHTFCRACLKAHVSRSAHCPCCRKRIQHPGSSFEVHAGIQEAIRQRADADKFALAAHAGYTPFADSELTPESPHHAAWAKLCGLGTAYDLAGGAFLLRTAADGCHKPSAAMLAYLLYIGIGVKKNRAKAMTLLRVAAAGSAAAAGDSFAIAALETFGLHNNKNALAELAEGGFVPAAVMFYVANPKHASSDRLIRAAAAQGDVFAMYESGKQRFSCARAASSECDRAVLLVTGAAAAGLAVAQDWLGRHLLLMDHPDAVGWLKKSAGQGCLSGILQLGFCYVHGGVGVAPDRSLALKWLESAARRQKGACYAHELIGLMWEKGLAEGPTDYAEAMRQYKLAIGADSRACGDALSGIGRLLEKGLGVPVDTTAAMSFYTSAGAAGCGTGPIDAARLSAVLAIRTLGDAVKAHRAEGVRDIATLGAVSDDLTEAIGAAGFKMLSSHWPRMSRLDVCGDGDDFSSGESASDSDSDDDSE